MRLLSQDRLIDLAGLNEEWEIRDVRAIRVLASAAEIVASVTANQESAKGRLCVFYAPPAIYATRQQRGE